MYVFAKRTASVLLNGRKYTVKGDSAWHAGSVLVKARPDLFSDQPRLVYGDKPPEFEPQRVTREPTGDVVTNVSEPAPKKRGRKPLPRDENGNVIRP